MIESVNQRYVCAITDAEAAADPRYDQGCFVVGSGCLRKHLELRSYVKEAS